MGNLPKKFLTNREISELINGHNSELCHDDVGHTPISDGKTLHQDAKIRNAKAERAYFVKNLMYIYVDQILKFVLKNFIKNK
jgi:hypothetical protein